MKRFIAWGVAALLIACGIGIGVSNNAVADILTKGKVYLSADRTTYIEYDGTDINFVVGGTEVFASSVAGTTAFTGAVTTTNGIASGTAKTVGGRAYSATSASDNLLASAGASAHVDFAQKYTMPANTLLAGTVVKVSGSVNATDASGTDTLEVKVYLGTTALTTTTAFDPDAAADFVRFSCTIVGRAAPGAAAAVVAECEWTSEDGTTQVAGANILATTNFATNGALDVKASAKWSATTANTNARLETFNVEVM